MSQFVSKCLLLIAACLGTIPADNCVLMLAGDCCDESHVEKLDCQSHQHQTMADDADHDADGHHHHHLTCIVISSCALTLQVQHAPAMDLHQDVAPLDFARARLACVDNAAQAGDLFDRCGRVKPPDPPLFLLTHSFLI